MKDNLQYNLLPFLEPERYLTISYQIIPYSPMLVKTTIKNPNRSISDNISP